MKRQRPTCLALSPSALTGELSGRWDTFRYQAEAVDNTATLTTLTELGRHAGPLARKPDQVMALITKLEQRLETGTPYAAATGAPSKPPSSPSKKQPDRRKTNSRYGSKGWK